MRGDRIVLPDGETYGGFCVPKEFSLLYAIIIAAVNPVTSTEMLQSFGIPKDIHPSIIDDLRKILKRRMDLNNDLEWEKETADYLLKRYNSFFKNLGKHEYLYNFPKLAITLEKAGIIAGIDESRKKMRYRLAYWVDKKAQGMEEINRVGPFRKVNLISKLLEESRQKNSDIPPDNETIGVMSVAYKEGARNVDGKDIPITDVRFSSGARKMEIYAGTAKEHLLKDIDPEGRELVTEMLKNFTPPMDIRCIGLCTGTDVLNHVPQSGLESIKDWVNDKLLELGLDQTMIDANCKVYGANLKLWSGFRDLNDEIKTRVMKEIGHKIHLLVLSQRGPYRTYNEALQGVDFVDLSIPDPELLDLIDDLPKLVYLIRKGRSNSAQVFADGTSGGRRRAFSFRYTSSKFKVKQLFAIDDNIVYGSLGLGQETISSWRKEMEVQRDFANKLFITLMNGKTGEVNNILHNFKKHITDYALVEEAINDQITASKLQLPSSDIYRYISQSFLNFKQSNSISSIDYGTWLAIGGQYVVINRLTYNDLVQQKQSWDKAVDRVTKSRFTENAGLKEKEIYFLINSLNICTHTPVSIDEFQETTTAISGSLKAVEEKIARLETREVRRQLALRAQMLRSRQKAFQSTELPATHDFDGLYNYALSVVGDGTTLISQEMFGQYISVVLKTVKTLLSAITKNFTIDQLLINRIQTDGESLLSGTEIKPEVYLNVVRNISKLTEAVSNNYVWLNRIATVLELLDISLAIEKTTAEINNKEKLILEIARFFDITINNHIFDYIPYHYHKERTSGFEKLSREEKFTFAKTRHQWLYRYLRNLLANHTELADRGQTYCSSWIGDALNNIIPLGVDATNEDQKFWFSYARLRDVAVLKHEGFALPEILLDVKPDDIKAASRANVVIVYPHGNTTVPVALEQCVKLAVNENINLILTAFPEIKSDETNNQKVLYVSDGFMYLSEDEFITISGRKPLITDPVTGVLVLVKFAQPIIAHGIFFHFTHPLRTEIDNVTAPLIQPLVWEAATHLKCLLPEMLKGSGVQTAGQLNWYQKQSQAVTSEEAKRQISNRIKIFSTKYPTLIVKAEKESGGRSSKILPIRTMSGELIKHNLSALTELVYDISKTDNVVIQNVLKSYVRKLYSQEFLSNMVDRFAKIGVPVILNRDPVTPLFSYFRQVVVRGVTGLNISHHITVVSTKGIANVGQGGLLYEYTDDIIAPKYRKDLRVQITTAAIKSYKSEEKYIKKHWHEILDEYLLIYPEFRDKVGQYIKQNPKAYVSRGIPYEMGDYMPVFLVNNKDELVQVYDYKTEQMLQLYNKNSNPTNLKIYGPNKKPILRRDKTGKVLPIRMFDNDGKRIPLYDQYGKLIPTLVVYKIEPNPGAGLWRPHNDQLPPHRKGEGVYIIYKSLGELAKKYKESIGNNSI